MPPFELEGFPGGSEVKASACNEGDQGSIPGSGRSPGDVLLCSVVQSCPTLCNPADCSPSGSFVHEDSPGKNTGVGCHALLQGIFPTQGLNPGLPICRRILSQLSYQGSPHAIVIVHLYSLCIHKNVSSVWTVDSLSL